MLNRIVLIGRLVADPQLRYTSNGVAVTNFRIAVDRPFTNQQGERETDFIDIVCWRKLAETVAHHLTKGRLVGVDGRLQIRQYEWEGQKRQAAEVYADNVQFLDSRRDTASSSPAPPAPEPPTEFDGGGPDDVPF
jgi:single-strand DNA-binding protein